MRTSSVVLMIAGLALAGCADELPSVRWSRPGATYDQFVQDRAACVTEARAESEPFILGGARYAGKRDVLDSSVFVPCMAARGYRQDPQGFAAPPGDELPLAP